MPTVVDTLVTKYTLDAKGYQTGAAQVTRTTKVVGDAAKKAKSQWKQFDDGFQSFSNVAGTALRTLATGAGIILGISTAAAAAGIALARSAAEYDAQVKALEAIEGSAKDTAEALKDLRDIARAPGLGFLESIQGFTRLRRAGFGGDEAKEILRQFGNVNALGGGGREVLDRIMLALQQMANKRNFGQEMMQLSEAGLPAFAMLKQLFGTSDTEELLKNGVTGRQVIAAFTAELAKLPRVSGGAKNAFENVGDAINYASIKAGSAINEYLIPELNAAVDVLDNLSDSGAITTAFDAMMQNVMAIVEGSSASMEDLLLSALEAGVAASAAIRNFALNAKELFNWLLGPLARLIPSLSGDAPTPAEEGAMARQTMEMQMEMYKRRAAREADKKKNEQAAAQSPEEDPVQAESVRILRAIESNTAPIREMMSYIFGGGDLGRIGVSRVSIGGGAAQVRQLRKLRSIGTLPI